MGQVSVWVGVAGVMCASMLLWWHSFVHWFALHVWWCGGGRCMLVVLGVDASVCI